VEEVRVARLVFLDEHRHVRGPWIVSGCGRGRDEHGDGDR